MIVPAGTRPLLALNRRHVYSRSRRGLHGLGLLATTGFTDIQSYLDAAAAEAGLAVCRTGTYTGCPDPAGYANLSMQAEQAWFAAHPAPGLPGSVTSNVTGLTTPAASPTAAPPAVPTPVRTPTPPSRVTQAAQKLANASSVNQTPPAGGQQVLQSSGVPAPVPVDMGATAPSFFSLIPWWGWALGAGGALYLMKGGRR